ncbi:MAG: HD domain-containing protein [Thermoleophilia bacterium]|nr:HD domain-containing protein [Thermoleophilia bacterium]
MAISEADIPRSATPEQAVSAGGQSQSAIRTPAIIIALIVSILVAAELLSSGSNEVQEILFLGYFFPIALSARYFSRKKTIFITALCASAYAAAFIPNMIILSESREELIAELTTRIGLFLIAGIGLSYFRVGIDREKGRALIAEHDRAERRKLMLEISTTVSSTLKIDQVLQLLSTRIVEAVDASFCRIMLLDTEGHNLRVIAAHPVKEMDMDSSVGLTVPVSELPEHKRAIETKAAVIIGGRRQDVSEPVSQRQREFMTSAKSLLLYPLVVGDEAVGVVCIGEHRSWERSPMSSEKAALCQTIVNQGAMAVGHALSHQALEEAFTGTIRSLAEAIDAKDPSTRGHSDWVSKYALMIGRQMGMGNGDLDELKYAGYLHDVGKIGIPDEILGKTSQLSTDEWKLMKKHPIVSARILDPVPISASIKAAIRHHHERFDGKGYPYGLAGGSIPLAARIMSVADSYEAMTSDRPYRKALSDEQAVAELVRCSGTQFDPDIVNAFMRSLGRALPITAADMDVDAESVAG